MLVARAVRLSAARIQGLPCGCLYVQGLPLYAPSLQSRGLPLPTFAAPHSSAVCPLETPADARGARASPHRLRGLARLAVFRLQLSTAVSLPCPHCKSGQKQSASGQPRQYLAVSSTLRQD